MSKGQLCPLLSSLSAALTKARVISAIVVGLTLAACQVLGGSAESTPKAIFIIVDGVPAHVIDDSFTPHIDELMGSQGYARSYVGGEIGGPSQSPTVSAVGYNSLLTDTWANKRNVYDNAIENPNYQYWDIFRIAKHENSSLKTALSSTSLENRTPLVGDGLSEAGGNKRDYYFDGLEREPERFPHDESRN